MAEPVPGSLRRLIEAGIGTPEAWRSIAESGLEAVHRRMVVSEESGEELPLASLLESAPQPHLETVEVKEKQSRNTSSLCPTWGGTCMVLRCVTSSPSGVAAV